MAADCSAVTADVAQWRRPAPGWAHADLKPRLRRAAPRPLIPRHSPVRGREGRSGALTTFCRAFVKGLILVVGTLQGVGTRGSGFLLCMRAASNCSETELLTLSSR